MLTAVATRKELYLARESVKESMERLFPGYVYSTEAVTQTDKLTTVTFTFTYSLWAAFRLRMIKMAQQLFNTLQSL